MIGPQVTVGDRCRLGPRSRLVRNVRLAEDVSVGDGIDPRRRPAGSQVSRRGDLGRDRARAPSSASTRPSTARTSHSYRTVVGARCFIMTYVHLAHDCHVGDEVTIANGTQCAGHVTIHDRAVLSGLNAVHQFVTIGTLRLRRRRLPGQPGHPAVREGGGQPDGAVRPQLHRAAARRVLGRHHRRAQARLPAVLQLRAQPLAGARAGPDRHARRRPRSSGSSSSSNRPSGACRRDRAPADRRHRRRRARPPPRPPSGHAR